MASFFKNKTPALRDVPAPVLRGLARQALLRVYARNQYIDQIGDPARELRVILEGMVCINRCSLKGNKISSEIFVAGDLLGLRALHSRVCECTVQAIRDTRLAAIPGEAVFDHIERHPKLACALLRVLGERQTFLESQVLLAREPVSIRLAAVLLYLHHKFGPTLPMTRAEIGEIAGTTSETSMRIMKRFEQRGLLRRSPRRQVVISDLSSLYAELTGSLPAVWPIRPRQPSARVPRRGPA